MSLKKDSLGGSLAGNLNLSNALKAASKGKIIPSVIAAVSERNSQVSTYPSGCIHPSSLYKKCIRAAFFQLKDVPRNPTIVKAKTRMIWDLGHYVEANLVEYLKSYYGEQLRTQVSACLEDYNIRGNLDVVLDLPDYTHGVEIKSSNDFWFGKVKREGPPTGYVWQAMYYLKVLELDKLSWLYYNKNTSELLEIELKYEEETWKEILDKAYKINKAVALDTAPPMLSKCKFDGDRGCEYRKACLKRCSDDGECPKNEA